METHFEQKITIVKSILVIFVYNCRGEEGENVEYLFGSLEALIRQPFDYRR